MSCETHDFRRGRKTRAIDGKYLNCTYHSGSIINSQRPERKSALGTTLEIMFIHCSALNFYWV